MSFLRLLAGILSTTIAAGAFAAEATPVPTDLVGVRHTQAGGYETYALLLSTAKDILDVSYKADNGRDLHVMFVRKKASEMIAAIDKFLEWEQLATSRGETLSKKIAGVGSVSGSYVFVGLKSLEKGKHVLEMGVRSKLLGDSSGAAAGVVDVQIDRANAEKLKIVLERFAKGEKLDAVADVYR